jgi:hypothetical protein
MAPLENPCSGPGRWRRRGVLESGPREFPRKQEFRQGHEGLPYGYRPPPRSRGRCQACQRLVDDEEVSDRVHTGAQEDDIFSPATLRNYLVTVKSFFDYNEMDVHGRESSRCSCQQGSQRSATDPCGEPGTSEVVGPAPQSRRSDSLRAANPSPMGSLSIVSPQGRSRSYGTTSSRCSN